VGNGPSNMRRSSSRPPFSTTTCSSESPAGARHGTLDCLELDPPPKFDLVIVDEAHHIRNSETFLHQAVRYFADNAEAVVFLTATPVQLGREDLYTMLNVLRPDVIIDPASFAQMAEPNQYINAGVQACRRGEAGWTDEVGESSCERRRNYVGAERSFR
jgi:ATP-dependent helicase HepA